jgi:hypothetical protein
VAARAAAADTVARAAATRLCHFLERSRVNPAPLFLFSEQPPTVLIDWRYGSCASKVLGRLAKYPMI